MSFNKSKSQYHISDWSHIWFVYASLHMMCVFYHARLPWVMIGTESHTSTRLSLQKKRIKTFFPDWCDYVTIYKVYKHSSIVSLLYTFTHLCLQHVLSRTTIQSVRLQNRHTNQFNDNTLCLATQMFTERGKDVYTLSVCTQMKTTHLIIFLQIAFVQHRTNIC